MCGLGEQAHAVLLRDIAEDAVVHDTVRRRGLIRGPRIWNQVSGQVSKPASSCYEYHDGKSTATYVHDLSFVGNVAGDGQVEVIAVAQHDLEM